MEPERLNSCLLKTVSQPFSGLPETTEKRRLFQCGRFKGCMDFYLGFSPPTPTPTSCAFVLFFLSFFFFSLPFLSFFIFGSSVFLIPLSEEDGSRERPPFSVLPRRAGRPAPSEGRLGAKLIIPPPQLTRVPQEPRVQSGGWGVA